ncbi:MAG: hypothetical protein ACI4TK_09830 [Agathobacter sp.]
MIHKGACQAAYSVIMGVITIWEVLLTPLNLPRRIRSQLLSAVRRMSAPGRKTYNDYVSQLSRMKTGLDAYNDATRRTIQSNMKEIRQRWGFPMNELENWNGAR